MMEITSMIALRFLALYPVTWYLNIESLVPASSGTRRVVALADFVQLAAWPRIRLTRTASHLAQASSHFNQLINIRFWLKVMRYF